MKTPVLVTLAALAGLTVAVRAFDRPREDGRSSSQTTYYANGQLETECSTRDGRREGPCRRFYSDGRKMAEGAYAEGRMEGPWTFWLQDGSVDGARTGSYAAGERTSP
jgi:antitoxin component YwqK of YwqJK toxin-antitoxin module